MKFNIQRTAVIENQSYLETALVKKKEKAAIFRDCPAGSQSQYI